MPRYHSGDHAHSHSAVNAGVAAAKIAMELERLRAIAAKCAWLLPEIAEVHHGSIYEIDIAGLIEDCAPYATKS